MNWFLASAAPVIVGIVLMGTGLIHPAILAYHLLCAVAVYRHRARIRTFLRGARTTVRWALGTTIAIAAVLLAAPLIQDPTPFRPLFHATLLRGGSPGLLF